MTIENGKVVKILGKKYLLIWKKERYGEKSKTKRMQKNE